MAPDRITFELPTAEEILRGETQAGVPRPAVLDRDHEPVESAPSRPTVAEAATMVSDALRVLEIAERALRDAVARESAS